MPTLDWLNRDAAFRIAHQVPYRLLEPVSSHGDGDARNLLVQGDNLEALKALLPLYEGPLIVDCSTLNSHRATAARRCRQ